MPISVVFLFLKARPAATTLAGMRRKPCLSIFLLAYFLTGVFTMGCEILWARLLALVLGCQSMGVFSILAGMFAGMALGALLVNRWVRHVRSPLRLFAALQIAAAAYALASPALLHHLAAVFPPLTGAGEASALSLFLNLGTASLVTLPGTCSLGAAFAAIVEARRRAEPGVESGPNVGGLYAAHVLGGVFGVFGTIYAVFPRWGIPSTASALAAVGLLAALSVRPWKTERSGGLTEDKVNGYGPRTATGSLILGVLLLTGFGGIGLQTVGIHVLSQVLSNTIYTFAQVAVAYLLGTALGAWLYARWIAAQVGKNPAQTVAILLISIILAVAVSGMVMAISPLICKVLVKPDAGLAMRALGETVVAWVVFVLPTLLMGACYTHLLAQFVGRGIGVASAANLFGCMLAPPVFGLVLLPNLDPAWALQSVLGVFAIALIGFSVFSRIALRILVSGLVIGGIAIVLLPASLCLVAPPEGYVEISRHYGAYGTVIVSELPAQGRRTAMRSLQVNRFHMGGRLAFAEQRMGHISLLLAPHAHRALFLGIGTGSTLGAVRDYPLTHIDAVEVVPEVVAAMDSFTDVNGDVQNDDRVCVIVTDARRFVASATSAYDVVVADLYHPARDGANSLYAKEHFDAIRRRLQTNGVFVQWLPLYQLDAPTLRIIIRTFLDAFPHACSFMGLYNVEMPILALVGAVGRDGRSSALVVNPAELRGALARGSHARAIINGIEDVLGAYMLDADGLRAFADRAPVNCDLHPHVLFSAPHAGHRREAELGRANLRLLLDARRPVPPSLLQAGPSGEAATLHSVEVYSQALSLFLEAELTRAGRWDEQALSASIPGHIAAFETDPRFRAVLGILLAASEKDRLWAERILPRLLKCAPHDTLIRRAHDSYLQRAGRRLR